MDNLWKKYETILVKGLTTFLILGLGCLAVSGWAEGDYVFRRTQWGMSPEEIKASEKGQEDSEPTEELVYLEMVLRYGI